MQKLSSLWIATIGAIRYLGFISLLIVLPVAFFTVRLFDKGNWPNLVRYYYRGLVKVLGFQLRVFGAPSETRPTLFVSNHTSYLDVPVLGSILPASFVSKSDVASWPVIGTLARMQNTAFIERKAGKAGEQRNDLRSRLEKGQSLILFPEGTSTDGGTVLPFRSSLFGIAENPMADGRFVTIQPISIVCRTCKGQKVIPGEPPFYAWFGDMTFLPHIWNVFKYGRFAVDVYFHPVTDISRFTDRKELTAACQQQVASVL